MKALKLLVLVLMSISTGATCAQNVISGRVTDTREKIAKAYSDWKLIKLVSFVYHVLVMTMCLYIRPMVK